MKLETYIYDDNDTYYSVSGIGEGAFKNCKKLKKFTGAYLEHIGAKAFSGCDKLKSVAFPAFYGTKTDVKNCFKGSSIKSVHVYDYDEEGAKEVFTKKNTGSKNKIKIYGDFLGY